MSSIEITADSATAGLTGDYTLDPAHTRLGFVARHAMVTRVRGQFTDFDGTIHIDAEDPAKSTAAVTVRTASVGTGQEQRDQHLRSADFFEPERFPEMTFHSTGAEEIDTAHYRLTGDLTIKGVTKPVTLDLEFTGSATDPFGNLRTGFEGRAVVNRKDWGLTWNAVLEAGGVLVSDKITIEIDVSAIKAVA